MIRRLLALVLAVAVVAAVAVWLVERHQPTITVTADFPTTIGLYPGDDVRMVGVPVGRISRITDEGDHVEVEMKIDESTPAAADTGAVIVPPGLLSSRYVQLTKPWLSGPRLADGAHLGESRTASPMELDDVTAQLNRLLTALGPKGANRKGALSQLVATSGRALDGNGTTLRRTLTDLASALDTLGRSRSDIIGTINQLQTFVTALSGSDGAIRSFERNLSGVTTNLAHQHAQLAATIHGLAATTHVVRGFVRRNGGRLTVDVRLLERLTTTLVDRRRDLMEIADLAPIGTENIFGAANLKTGVLDARVDLTPLLAHPDTTLCQILEGAGLPQLCPSSVPKTPSSAGGGR
ncbi:MAG: MCE family protein [Nocardioidaceae bacterium]|nr:MCE family protein [Nocardioidaceae bacterium]MCL2612443.1 MCE family protein [Nocardioidaceae bacterium]